MRIVAGMLEADARPRAARAASTHDADGTEYRRRLGVASAGNVGLYARLGVRAHLDFFARIAFVAPDRRDERVEAAMARFALHELGGQRVDRLSMGQRQRVRLAAAFLHEAPLVLLDEPATSLDERGTALLADAITAHLAGGRAAVWFGPSGTRPARRRPDPVAARRPAGGDGMTDLRPPARRHRGGRPPGRRDLLQLPPARRRPGRARRCSP